MVTYLIQSRMMWMGIPPNQSSNASCLSQTKQHCIITVNSTALALDVSDTDSHFSQWMSGYLASVFTSRSYKALDRNSTLDELVCDLIDAHWLTGLLVIVCPVLIWRRSIKNAVLELKITIVLGTGNYSCNQCSHLLCWPTGHRLKNTNFFQ